MKKVLFYPDPPIQLPGHTLSKTITYFQLIGYELTNDIDSDWDIAVHWTRMDDNKVRCEVPVRLMEDPRLVLNRDLFDISKTYVNSIFREAFGYSSLANTSGHGYCVRKSERQSAHDGKFVKMPCSREEGYVYQILIDNRISPTMVCDIRFPVFFNEIPLVFLKSKSLEGTFENSRSSQKKYWVDKVENWVTDLEIIKIRRFCYNFRLDIGEIDTLRDNSTGKLYIVDVNHTPGGDVFKHIKDGEKVRKDLAFFLKNKIESHKLFK